MIPTRHRRRTALALVVFSAGCTELTAPPPDPAAGFTAELSGLIETHLQGAIETSGGAGERWTLVLATSGGAERIRFWTREGVGPLPAGEYALVDSVSADGGEAPGDHVMARVELASNAFPNPADFDFLVGTLTITAGSSGGAEGTFQLATSVLGQPTRILVARGEFGRPNPQTAWSASRGSIRATRRAGIQAAAIVTTATTAEGTPEWRIDGPSRREVSTRPRPLRAGCCNRAQRLASLGCEDGDPDAPIIAILRGPYRLVPCTNAGPLRPCLGGRTGSPVLG